MPQNDNRRLLDSRPVGGGCRLLGALVRFADDKRVIPAYEFRWTTGRWPGGSLRPSELVGQFCV